VNQVTNNRKLSLGSFAVEAAFLGEVAAFALGSGSVGLIKGTESGKVPVHSGAILSATPTRDGKALLTGGDDGRVALVDSSGAVTVVAEHKGKWIDHVAAGPNGAIAYACGRQVSVLFGDGRKRTLDLARAAGGLAFAPKGMRLAVATYDGAVLWWIGTDADPVSYAWKGAHFAISFSPDGRYLVTAMQENALHGWRLADGHDMRMSGYPAKTRSLAWTAKGRFLATSGANAAVLWPFHAKDGPMGKEPKQLGERNVLITRVAAHPRKEQVAIGFQDGVVALVGIDDGSRTAFNSPGGGPVSALAFDARGGLLAFGTEEGAGGIVELAG